MDVIQDVEALRFWRRGVAGSVGLVPTMGALHDGHLSLVRRARSECGHVAVSIFVNPTQFASASEVATYPRTLEGDLELLRAESVDAVFIPDASEMYRKESRTRIHVSGLTDRLEGASRPGHFGGVCLVVCKLFNLFQPDRAYFGLKDYQQLLVIRQMVGDLNIPVEVIAAETIRDADGLAISSRNVLLSERERVAARLIPEALFEARSRYRAGERSAGKVLGPVRSRIELSDELSLEYAAIADAETLEELEGIVSPAVLLVAVRCGHTRLIDNVLLD